MRSIKFPDMFTRTSTNYVEDYDATLQNLKYLILSEKNSLFGDPYYGVGLKKYLFDQNDDVLKDILLDDIYTSIASFMPQLKVSRNNINLEQGNKGEIYVTAKATNRADFTTNMYSIVLLESEI